MTIRRFGAYIIAIVLIAFLAGQATAEIGWEAGLKIGANGSRLTGDQVSLWITPPNWDVVAEVDETKIGFIGGFYALASLSDVFAIQCEVLYAQCGGKGPINGWGPVELGGGSITQGEIDGEISLEVDYIEVPLLAAFKFINQEKLLLNVVIGPYVAFETRAQLKVEGTAKYQDQNLSEKTQDFSNSWDYDKYVKSWDIGALVGIGVIIPLNKVSLLFDARYSHGFRSIDNMTDPKDVKNSAFTFLAGISLPLGSN